MPRSDLLKQVDGIEGALQWTRRVGIGGRIGLLLSAIPVTAVVVSSGAGGAVLSFDWSKAGDRWPELTGLAAVVLFLVLVNWTRIWVRESTEPFRYTFSVSDFAPIAGADPEPRLRWLRVDLMKLLSDRIGRVSLLENSAETKRGDEANGGDEAQRPPNPPESHIHVGGTYGIRRETSDGSRHGEVVPWVMLGAPPAPATLGHAVKFTLSDKDDGSAEYEALLERVYFSIATHLYRQIRLDVDHKIGLLPKRYFRAAAYYHEASDYVHSNTLDAYDEAEDLFGRAIALYEPNWERLSKTRLRHIVQQLGRVFAKGSLFSRRLFAWAWPRLGRVEILVARAEIGYANVLVDRRELAGLSGRWLNPVYPARPIAERAIRRLRSKLLSDVEGRDDALFDAYVALASVLAELAAPSEAAGKLDEARQLLPARAEQDPRYLYVRGRVVPRRGAQFLQRALELAPWFEAAQFSYAYTAEMLWRRRPTLERNVADNVIAEYKKVLERNPGNIAAWSNIGYVRWLLGGSEDLRRAKDALERGREYKQIKSETFVSELDYGLARIAAEEGDFRVAYQRYIDAVTALFAKGVSHAPDGYTSYHFDGMTQCILERFDSYKTKVEELYQRKAPDGRDEVSERIRKSVYAFVLNDYGEAYLNYFLRTGESRYLEEARKVLEQARRELGTRYPMIDYNLSRLLRWQVRYMDEEQLRQVIGAEDRERDERLSDLLLFDTSYIERTIRFEPHWADGLLEHAQSESVRARQAAAAARVAKAMAKELKPDTKPKAPPHGDGASDVGGRATEEGDTDRFVSRADLETKLSQAAVEMIQVGLPPVATPAAPTPATSSAEQPIPVLAVQAVGGGGRPPPDAAASAERAQRLADVAEELATQAKRCLDKANDVCMSLLPHEWLRRGAEFDPAGALRSARRRWESELDDLHVRALFTWCDINLLPLDVDEEAPEAPERPRLKLRRKTREPEGAAEPAGSPRRKRIWRLVQRLQAAFMPNSFELLELCRTFPEVEPKVAEEYVAREKALIKDMLERSVWWGLLAWLDDSDMFAEEEVREILVRLGDESDLPAALYIAIGTRLFELGERDHAITALRRVRRSRDVELVQKAARLFEEHELWNEAIELYKRGHAIVSDSQDPVRANPYRLAVGRCLWRLGQSRKALSAFGEIQGRDGLAANWREALVRELLRLEGGIDASGYRLLKRWLGRELSHAQRVGDRSRRKDAAGALLILTRRRYHQLVRRPLGARLDEVRQLTVPGVDPLVLEADESLFGDDEQNEAVARLTDVEIPELRAKLADELGLDLPPVRILSSAGRGRGGYVLYVRELPIESGRFSDGELFFVPDGRKALGLELDGEAAASPVDGHMGLWIQDVSAAREKGLEVWDRYTFMLRHLVAVFERRLGVENLVDVLAAWEAESSARQAIRKRALNDEAALVRFATVVNALLGDRIPLVELRNRLGDVLQAFEGSPPDADVLEVAEGIRSRLRDVLPGTDVGTRLIRVPPKVEQELAMIAKRGDGNGSVLLPRADYAASRQILSKHLPAEAREGDAALVVSRRGLRRIVRSLSARKYPSLPVVFFGELPAARRLGTHVGPGR